VLAGVAKLAKQCADKAKRARATELAAATQDGANGAETNSCTPFSTNSTGIEHERGPRNLPHAASGERSSSSTSLPSSPSSAGTIRPGQHLL
jgi:hypothetical protein